VAVMRTQRPFFRSWPSPLLLVVSMVVALTALAVPVLPLATQLLDFVPLPAPLLGAILGIVLTYAAASEVLMRRIGLLGPSSAS